MSADIALLNAVVERDQAQRAETDRAAIKAARERLTPLEERLSRLLATIPVELQKEGMSLPSLQVSLRGRWRGNCHPGELGMGTPRCLDTPHRPLTAQRNADPTTALILGRLAASSVEAARRPASESAVCWPEAFDRWLPIHSQQPQNRLACRVHERS
jgi:hypothetical protein